MTAQIIRPQKFATHVPQLYNQEYKKDSKNKLSSIFSQVGTLMTWILLFPIAVCLGVSTVVFGIVIAAIFR